jgi:hypothetical protein
MKTLKEYVNDSTVITSLKEGLLSGEEIILKNGDEFVKLEKYFKDGVTGYEAIQQIEAELKTITTPQNVTCNKSSLESFFKDSHWAICFAYKRKSEAQLVISNGKEFYKILSWPKYPNISRATDKISINGLSRSGIKEFTCYNIDINKWPESVKECFEAIKLYIENDKD